MPFDHDDTDQLPGSPDEPASPDEAARARAFAGLVDDLLAGRALPADADADEDARSLVDTAAIMRANLGPSEHAPVRVSALIDDVLARARERAGATPEGVPEAGGDGPGALPDAGVIDLAARRSRLVRYAPWGLSALAAAAALVFALRTPAPAVRPEQPETQLSMMHRSRPADPLVGQIPRARADRASERLDIIYADRMAGYRDLSLRGGGR